MSNFLKSISSINNTKTFNPIKKQKISDNVFKPVRSCEENSRSGGRSYSCTEPSGAKKLMGYRPESTSAPPSCGSSVTITTSF